MSAHIRIFLFLSQSDVCLLKPPKNRYFLYQALVHSTINVTPVTDRHFFNCSILLNDSWRKCVWIFFILHSETFRIATFWNAFAHSRIVQKGQPMNGCNIAMEFIFSVLRNLEDKALHSTTHLLLFKYRLIKKIKSSLKVRMTL